MMQFICYSKCSTCSKAKHYLNANKIDNFIIRDIKADNPTYEELNLWLKNSKIDINKLFNTNGVKYRELDMKNKIKILSDEEKLKILASDGLLVKRPILVDENNEIIVGFKEEEYDNFFNME